MKVNIEFKKVMYTVEVNDLSEYTSISVNGENAENIYYNPKREHWFAPFSVNGHDFWVIAKKSKIRLVPCVSGMSEQDFIHDYATRAYGGLVEFLFAVFGIIAPCAAALIIAYAYNIDIPTSLGAGIGFISYYWFIMCNTSPILPLSKKKKYCFFALLGPVICFALFGIGLILK